jgi:hypothetical protein
MIHRVRVNQLLPDLTTRQVFAFRMAGTQQEAEDFGHRLQTRWMELNPGYATVMRVDWPTPDELGGHHVQPPTPDLIVGR